MGPGNGSNEGLIGTPVSHCQSMFLYFSSSTLARGTELNVEQLVHQLGSRTIMFCNNAVCDVVLVPLSFTALFFFISTEGSVPVTEGCGCFFLV